MKLIKQSYEILGTPKSLNEAWEFVAKAARNCYQSQKSKPDESEEQFCRRLLLKHEDDLECDHLSPFEFGVIYLTQRYDVSTMREKLFHKYINNPYSRVTFDDDGGIFRNAYITTNLRVILENHWENDLKYAGPPTKYHVKACCFKLITNRAIMCELTRHRSLSFCVESTRYVSSCTRHSIAEFNCNIESDIVKAYNEGFSMHEISLYSQWSENTIKKFLLQNNVKLRGLNNKGNRDNSYFSSINTPEKAYLLGLIQTDGNVRKSFRNASLTVTQHQDYSWYIKDLLYQFSDYVSVSEDKNCHQVQIGSKQIVDDLISLGIIPNKTYDQTSEDIDHLWAAIPEEFKGDFIRGLIDGDGYVTYFTQPKAINESCNIGFCSYNKHLIDLIADYIKTKFSYKVGRVEDSSVYKLYITDYCKSIEIGTWLYSNFKYPFGHPKKAATWIKRLQINYPFGEYRDSKFKIIIPNWLSYNNSEGTFSFINTMDSIEDCYTNLRLGGWQAQQAATILPNALKTTIMMCGYEDSLQHMFRLRAEECSGPVHPQMKELMVPMYESYKQWLNETDY